MAQRETWRTFIALPLSDACHAHLKRIQQDLKRACPTRDVRWVPPENIHLTLFFVGDVILERIDPLKAALAVITRNAAPFTYQVRDIGAFPNVRRPRVVWVGVKDPSGRLKLLHRAVNEALENVGFTPDTRPFSPHLTLGRIKRRAKREVAFDVGSEVRKLQDAGVDLGEETASDVVLFRSVLKSTGAEYTALATFVL